MSHVSEGCYADVRRRRLTIAALVLLGFGGKTFQKRKSRSSLSGLGGHEQRGNARDH